MKFFSMQYFRTLDAVLTFVFGNCNDLFEKAIVR